MERDQVSHILAQWAREQPEFDTSPMAVIERISRLSHIIERHLEPTFASLGLSGWSFDVLATLRRSGQPYRLSPTKLFNVMLVTSGTMTNRIDRLEQAGLVVRVPDSDDRRSILVELTPKGLGLIDVAVSTHLSNERRLLQALSADEQATLADLLRKLLYALEKAPVPQQET